MTSALPCFLIVLASMSALRGATQGQENCPSSDTEVRVVAAKELTAAAIKKVDPDIPGGLGRIEADVPVHVVVDTEGNVVCARALLPSQPMLRKYCEEAARRWQFKPFLIKGKPSPIQGSIVFHVQR